MSATGQASDGRALLSLIRGRKIGAFLATVLVATRYRVVAGLAALFCVGVIVLSDTPFLVTSAVVVLLTVPIYFARLRRTTP